MSGTVKTPEKSSWIKRFLKKDVPDGKSGGVKPDGAKLETAPQANGPRPGVDNEAMVVAQQFGQMLREKPYADLPQYVRNEMRKPIEDAIAARQFDQAKTLMTTFQAEAAKAAEEVAKVAVAEKHVKGLIDSLRGKIEALKGTDLNALTAEKSLDVLKKAHDSANSTPLAGRAAALDKVGEAVKKAIADAVGHLVTKANKGSEDGLTVIRKGAADAIAALPKGDPEKALTARLAAWDKTRADAMKLTDPNKAKTILDALNKSAEKLLDDALAASAGTDPTKKAAADLKKQNIFKDAITKRFGIKVDDSDGTTNTHYDQFFEMMASVPVQQSTQSSLNLLTYDKKGTGAAYGSGTLGKKPVKYIQMGGAIDEDAVGWEYHGKKVEVFKINTLHEIGHSVDDKYGIMSSHMGSKGCGGWANTNVDAVAQTFLTTFRKAEGKDVKVDDKALLKAIKNALLKAAVKDEFGNTSVSAPDDTDKAADKISDSDWPTIKGMLERCIKIRSDNWPWGVGQAVVMNSKAWHESYPGTWVNYDPSARASMEEVRDYQWRAPGEWFAELYAYTWYKKQLPKGGVDKEAAKYMWNPDEENRPSS